MLDQQDHRLAAILPGRQQCHIQEAARLAQIGQRRFLLEHLDPGRTATLGQKLRNEDLDGLHGIR